MADETLEELANKAKKEEEAKVATTTQVETPATKPLSPELAELVGEGKKYATQEQALNSVPAAQAHIIKLESQIASNTEIKDLLAEAKEATQAKGPPAEKVGTSQQDVSEMVRVELANDRQNQLWNSNIIKIDTAFKSAYKDKGQEVYNKLAEENGMTVEGLNELSKAAPEVVLKLAGLSKQVTTGGSIKSDINTQALNTDKKPSDETSRIDDPSDSAEVLRKWRIAGEKAKEIHGIPLT